MKEKINNTRNYYNKNAETYFKTTSMIDTSSICASFENYLLQKDRKKSLILDAGCGSGRDSAYFREKQYQVVSMDLSFNLLQLAQKKITGFFVNADFYNIPIGKSVFDGVFANASLLHIPKKRLNEVIKNIFYILKENGIFFLSLKKGNSENIDENGRFFAYYENNEIENILGNMNFKILELSTQRSIDERQIEWISAIVRKP